MADLTGRSLSELIGMFGAERAAGVIDGDAFDELIGRTAELTVIIRRMVYRQHSLTEMREALQLVKRVVEGGR